MATIKSIETLSSKELVAEYNRCAVALGEKEVKRFSDTKTALRRVAAILARMPEEKPVKRSAAEGIAASWRNPEVAAKRMTRHTINCGGVEFKSVRQAFEALNLPMNQHIKFRMSLKAAGKATFNHEGHAFAFALVEQY